MPVSDSPSQVGHTYSESSFILLVGTLALPVAEALGRGLGALVPVGLGLQVVFKFVVRVSDATARASG